MKREEKLLKVKSDALSFPITKRRLVKIAFCLADELFLHAMFEVVQKRALSSRFRTSKEANP